jgi:hypothetical protein
MNAESYRTALAWEIYCFETRGGMAVKDFWSELPEYVKEIFLHKVRARAYITAEKVVSYMNLKKDCK